MSMNVCVCVCVCVCRKLVKKFLFNWSSWLLYIVARGHESSHSNRFYAKFMHGRSSFLKLFCHF